MKEKIISLSLIFTLLFSSFSFGAGADDTENLLDKGKSEEIKIQDQSEDASLDDINPDKPGDFENEETEDMKSKEVDDEGGFREAIANNSINKITIANDIKLTEELEIVLEEDRDLTITSEVTDVDLWNKEDGTVKDIDKLDLPKITSNITNGENMIRVKGNGNLTIENLIFDGEGKDRILEANGINKLTINNSVFQNGSSESFGGGIYSKNRDILINSSVFLDNESKQSGGAIELGVNVKSEITKSLFKGNESTSGGAIGSNGNNEIIIANSMFQENKASIGGALDINGGAVNISETAFVRNKALPSLEGYYILGGSISIVDSKLEISKSNFEGNIADNPTGGYGGALYITECDTKIIDTTFKENLVERYEEGKNKNQGEGGAICISNGDDNLNFNLNNVYFEGNSADLGGAIYFSDGSNININNSTFNENKSDYIGGAIYFSAESNININNSTFNENEAIYGGALAFDSFLSDNLSDRNIDINNTVFDSNQSARIGGAIFIFELDGEYHEDGDDWYIEDIINSNVKDYENIHIDNTVEFKNNTTEDPLRFINGFEEEKYNDYKEIADKIEPNSQSYGASPFNNYDINMLGYEYYVAYKAPEDLKGKFSFKYDGKSEEFDIKDKELLFDEYLFNEVFKKEDDRTINIKPGAVIEYKREKDGKIETVEATLQSWDISEEDMNSTEKEEKDFILTGVWKEEITKTEEKPVDPGRPIDPEIKPVDPNPERPIGPGKPGEPKTPEIGDKLNLKDHFQYIEGYPDKTVRPEENISREEVTAIIFRILNPEYRDSIRKNTSEFPDISKDRWSAKHIGTLNNGGIVEGYPDGKFKGEKSITRGEVAAMIVRFSNEEIIGEHNLIDIKDHWAEAYIGYAVSQGWIEGYPDKTFKADEEITRGEFVTIINRMLERGTTIENMLEDRKEFKDLKEDKWYYEAMQEAINGHDYIKENDIEVWTELKQFDIEM